ncbi:MAG: UDP-glucose--undecaprenyl-phosphate glucose-1-phosphate transferase [Candidatus Latescibacteria bacterium]|nr:UDP-glucose--undecaprenyl-phosphate glucose-1-phosphate transferase [Candidatus Latescibacterota bacterium]
MSLQHKSQRTASEGPRESVPSIPLGPLPRGLSLSAKRGMDIVLSLLSVPLLIPLWIVLAILIRMESKGPVIFRQTRIGQRGKPFVLLKLRSMHDGAEDTTGPVWATIPDPRATHVGRFMRRFGLDETLQVINVIWGEMSLVGPRPERPYFVERLRREVDNYEARLTARPGITGWAQIHTDHKYDVSLADVKTKVALDLKYIEQWSLWLDLRVLAWTTIAVLQLRRVPRSL